MKTVKELKKELEKFDDDDVCFAYEGEVVGIIVQKSEYDITTNQGVIFCSEGDDSKFETKTID